MTSILICQQLKDFESISKALQKVTMTVADTRLLFDKISNAYLVVKEKLAADANIVVDMYFESAIIRIQQGKADSLMPSEEQSVRHLKKLPKQNHESNESDGVISFVDKAFKKQRLVKQGSPSEYLSRRMLNKLPKQNHESNESDYVMSSADKAFKIQSLVKQESPSEYLNRRMSVLPIHAEAQMFLHLNMDCGILAQVKTFWQKKTKKQ
jgi:hypothetical protein